MPGIFHPNPYPERIETGFFVNWSDPVIFVRLPLPIRCFILACVVSELVALNRSDVHIGERSGHVIVRDGKGGIARTG
jgi:hypothetical protein